MHLTPITAIVVKPSISLSVLDRVVVGVRENLGVGARLWGNVFICQYKAL